MLTPYDWSNFQNNHRTVISPFGEHSLKIKFQCICDECNSWIYPEELEIPEPNQGAVNNRESERATYTEFHCPKCDELYEITLTNSFGGIDVFIPGVESEYIFYKDIDEELEALLNTTNYFEIFELNIRRIEDYVNEGDDDYYLNNLLLLSCVSSMESYLSTALVKFIEGDEMRYKPAIKTLNRFDFINHIESIFENDLEKIKSKILSTIAGETFHSHEKIKHYFKGILDIEINYDFSTFGKIINKRHDIVHRNGRTKKNELLRIDKDELNNDINEIHRFINYINQELQNL